MFKEYEGFDVDLLKNQALYIESKFFTGNCLVYQANTEEIHVVYINPYCWHALNNTETNTRRITAESVKRGDVKITILKR